METPIREDYRASNIRPWIYLAAGAVAGATLGVLFAPAKGKETREKLQNWLKEKQEDSKKAILERKHRLGAAMAAGKTVYKEEELAQL